MKAKLFKAKTRGHADYGWLQANYSFSFANFRDAQRDRFGALRVLNDDFIKGGAGFAEHPHHNMEIISIPLQGVLKHKDSLSNTWIPLPAGEVQVMSAGTGVVHSERNDSASDELNLFQIWIIPEKNGVVPAYDQKAFLQKDRMGKLQELVSSYKDTNDKTLKIHQDARISRLDLSAQESFTYHLKSLQHGVYIMLISGEIQLDGIVLKQRDALGISQTNSLSLKALENADILFIEVPMIF